MPFHSNEKKCKCGRIFYDTDDNKKCPTCTNKRNVKLGGIAVGSIAIGTVIKNHSQEIKNVAKKVGNVVIKIAKK